MKQQDINKILFEIKELNTALLKEKDTDKKKFIKKKIERLKKELDV